MSTDTPRTTVALWSPKWNQVITVAESDVQAWLDKGCTVVTADFVPPAPTEPPAPVADTTNAPTVVTAPVSDIVAPNVETPTEPATADAPSGETPSGETPSGETKTDAPSTRTPRTRG